MIGAVDIGGTKIAMGLLTDDERLVKQERIATPKGDGAPEAAVAAISAFFAGSGAERIGVICTGPIDAKAGVVCNPYTLPGWDGFALRERLAAATGARVAMQHDVCGMLLGDLALQNLRGKRCFLLAIGTGVGCAYYDGTRLHGDGMRFAPEMGHVLCDSDGPDCYCGMRGCFESLCAGPALQAFAASRGHADFTAMMRSDDAQGVQIVRGRMQCAIWNLLCPFKPEVFLLGGGVCSAWFDWFKELTLEITEHRDAIYEPFEILPSCKTENSALIGAAQTVQEL